MAAQLETELAFVLQPASAVALTCRSTSLPSDATPKSGAAPVSFALGTTGEAQLTKEKGDGIIFALFNLVWQAPPMPRKTRLALPLCPHYIIQHGHKSKKGSDLLLIFPG